MTSRTKPNLTEAHHDLEKSHLEFLKHRDVNQWRIKSAGKLHRGINVNQVTRGATRDIDEYPKDKGFSLLQKQLIALFVIFASLFLLLELVGMITVF